MNIVLASRRKYMRKRTNPEGAPASIEDCIVSLVRDSYPYTGQAITPQVTVTTQDGVPLVVNVDYFVSYSDNINVGAGTVTVTGTGEYVGSVIKTFQITSAAPPVSGWQDFDLAKCITSSVKRSINTAYEYGGFLIPNGNIVLVKVGSGGPIVYIHSFEGGEFSVSALNFTPDSSHQFTNEGNYGIAFTDDGMSVIAPKWSNYYSEETSTFLSHTLDDAFDFSNVGSPVTKNCSLGDESVGYMAFSKDGMNAFYSHIANDGKFIVRSRELSVPYDLSSGSESKVNDIKTALSVTGNPFAMYGTNVSPDGSVFVVGYIVSGSNNQRIAKFQMSTPWDVSTATLSSYFTPERLGSSGYFTPGTVIVNNEGTKMLVFNSNSYSKEVIEYDLVK